MKVITTINWVIVGIYGLVFMWALLSNMYARQDPAGQGMLAGILVLFVLFLGILVYFNYLPYRWSKITALVLGVGPLILYLLGPGLDLLTGNAKEKVSSDVLLSWGAYYFRDPVRKQLAAIIATGNVTQLEAALQEPIPNLNESGEEHTTLLDFATLCARENSSSKAFRCIDLLMAKGATIETADPLHQPTHFRIIDSKDLFVWFLRKGADPNALSLTGNPMLFHVLLSTYDEPIRIDRVKALLDAGADPNATSSPKALSTNTSALIYATNQEMWDVCQLLLDKGADPAYKTPDGRNVWQIMADKEKTKSSNVLPAGFTALKERLNRVH